MSELADESSDVLFVNVSLGRSQMSLQFIQWTSYAVSLVNTSVQYVIILDNRVWI